MILRHISHFLVKKRKRKRQSYLIYNFKKKKNQDYFIKIAETVQTTLNFQLTC